MYEHLKGLVEYHLYIAKTIKVSGITEGLVSFKNIYIYI